MFIGSVTVTLDPKGRFSMPTRHRDAFAVACEVVGENILLMITKNDDGCLMIFPSSVWHAKSTEIAAWSNDAVRWKRLFFSNTHFVEMDVAGRILLPSELRASMGIGREAKLIGMGAYFELWDAQGLADHEAETLRRERPPEVKGFSF